MLLHSLSVYWSVMCLIFSLSCFLVLATPASSRPEATSPESLDTGSERLLSIVGGRSFTKRESVSLQNRNETNPFHGSSTVNFLVYHDPEGDFDVKFTHLSAYGSIANSLLVLSVALGAVFDLAFAHGAEYNFQERTVDWNDGGVRLRVTIDGADEQPLTINDVNGLFRGIIWMIRTTKLTVSTATFKMMRDDLDVICLGDWGFTQTDVPSD